MYFNTAKVHDNEVVKAVDFDYGFRSFIDNFSLGMKLILQRDNNFIVGGKVKNSGTGGMNLAIEPIYSFCKTPVTDIIQGVGNDEVTDLVTVVDSGISDRIDIVEVCGVVESYDEEQRAINDPETNVKTYPMIDVKQRVSLKAQVKPGVAGSAVAPSTTPGWVKIAEIVVKANAIEISENDIINVSADVVGMENENWTNEKTATINIGRISEVNERFRAEHNNDGTHKEAVIQAKNIDFGTTSSQVNGTKIPVGITASVGNSEITTTDKISVVVKTFADVLTSFYESYKKYEDYNFKGEVVLSDIVDEENKLVKPLVLEQPEMGLHIVELLKR